MGKVLSSVVKRYTQSFNVENRAQRAISPKVLKVAPRHSNTVEQFEKIKNDPQLQNLVTEQNQDLLKRLKNIRVASFDAEDNLKENSNVSQAVLPKSRAYEEKSEYGYFEPEVIPKGKCTLKQALHFISSHESDPQLWNVEYISKEYELSSAHVEQVLKHFHTFHVHFPEKMDEKMNVNLPKVLGIQMLPSPKKSSEKSSAQ